MTRDGNEEYNQPGHRAKSDVAENQFTGRRGAGHRRVCCQRPNGARSRRAGRVRRRRRRHPLPSKPDLKVSPHPARAFANAPRRTRLGLSATLSWSGFVDGSWRGASPSCHTFLDHLGYARPDGGCARAALRCEGLARTPCNVLVAFSRGTQSVLDPPECGSASRPTSVPDTVPTPGHRGWLHSESSPTAGF